ncbi:MAG TPA: hypothetical protein VGD52_21500 [Pseudoduganella sp.]|jgi:hypothetical protein
MILKLKLALAVLLCGATSVASADEFAAYKQAASQLRALPQPARAASPKAAPLFAILSDNQRFLESRTFAVSDMAKLREMCGTSTKLMATYMLDGTQAAAAAAGKDQQKVNAAVTERAARNARVFQDELAQLFPFAARCGAHLIPVTEAFTAKLPPEQLDEVRLAGVRQMQQGAFNTLSGTIAMLAHKEMDEAHLVRITRAVANSAPAYASVLSLAMRDQVKGMATTVQNTVSAEQAKLLAQVVQAMQDRKCNKLCMVSGK